MSFVLTQDAAERPRRTIHAAEVFHMNARTITAACAAATDEDVVVAVVSQNLVLAGVWTMPRFDLVERVPALENGGWTLTFAPGTDRAEVENRCIELGRSGFKRWEALRRWDSRHS